MMKSLVRWIAICLGFGPLTLLVAAAPVARTVIAVYDSKQEKQISGSMLHLYAETPLNHLGYRLLYQDVNQPLPDLSQRSEVAGVVTWLLPGVSVKDPKGYIRWLQGTVGAGKKVVLIGNPGFYPEGDDSPSLLAEANRFWAGIGLRDSGKTVIKTYLTRFTFLDSNLTGFERAYQGVLPPYRVIQVVDPRVASHATVRERDSQTEGTLIATGPHGGYAAEDYALYVGRRDGGEFKKWYINPYQFFRLTLDQEPIPKADTTTIAGRRIYYSQIDGDGWRSPTQLEVYQRDPPLCAEVIYRHVLEGHPDLPCTVAPIGADIDESWVGTPQSRAIAAKIFSLPHVEVGTHTYSHPFDWGFFEHYSPEKELPFLDRYPDGSWVKPTVKGRLEREVQQLTDYIHAHKPQNSVDEFDDRYTTPRAYALQPFSLKQEVAGSIDKIHGLTPAMKKVKVMQWSGNCLPFEAALNEVRNAGIGNLNGGSTRFDREFFSYAYVYPLGRRVGEEQQIYSTNSNENAYTAMWSRQFYGFDKLPQTYQNTEAPFRLRPMNLYYHMYSAERLASFSALQSNLNYIRAQSIAPIAMSHFAAIVQGFYTADFVPAGAGVWQVVNRGGLPTVRFDRAFMLAVDLSRSNGVVGQRHHQGSLYVYLDETNVAPTLTLTDHKEYWQEPAASSPYLIESRWRVSNVRHLSSAVEFTASGFGEGIMRWRVSKEGPYSVSVDGKEMFEVQATDGMLAFTLKPSLQSVRVMIRPGRNRIWNSDLETGAIHSWMKAARDMGRSLLSLHTVSESESAAP